MKTRTTIHRVPVGNFPKWLAYVLRWLIRRYNYTKGTSILLRGRRPKNGKRYGFGGDLKLADARRVGLYLLTPFTYFEVDERGWSDALEAKNRRIEQLQLEIARLDENLNALRSERDRRHPLNTVQDL